MRALPRVSTQAVGAPINPPPAQPEVEVTTLIVVDDHRSFADLLSAALNTFPDMRCLGTASTAAEGVALASRVQPNIVVMDIQMPHQDGLQATREIREACPDTVVAVLTAHTDPGWISRAAQAGASAFVPKDGSLKAIIDVLHRVRRGQMLVAPSTFDRRSDRGSEAPRAVNPALTPRELEVLIYLGQGMPAKSVSRVMGISLHTCRGYIKNLHHKLGASSQLEAVVKGQTLGLI